jgi:hypothetical protein
MTSVEPMPGYWLEKQKEVHGFIFSSVSFSIVEFVFYLFALDLCLVLVVLVFWNECGFLFWI